MHPQSSVIHRIVTGEHVQVGMRVYTNNLDQGVITELGSGDECGVYCVAWHTVQLDNGASVIMNCDRLATHLPPGIHRG